MKIAVIGGGSTYTPELVNGFLERIETLPVTELWLMDIDAERLDIVGGFAKRMVKAKGKPFKVKLTSDQQAAIQDASYVITQLRVGHMISVSIKVCLKTPALIMLWKLIKGRSLQSNHNRLK